jgi:hypothetical protein
VISGCVVAWVLQGDQTVRVGSFLVLYGLAFGAYLLAVVSSRGLSPRGLRSAVAISLLWRLALVLAPPLL